MPETDGNPTAEETAPPAAAATDPATQAAAAVKATADLQAELDQVKARAFQLEIDALPTANPHLPDPPLTPHHPPPPRNPRPGPDQVWPRPEELTNGPDPRRSRQVQHQPGPRRRRRDHHGPEPPPRPPAVHPHQGHRPPV